MKSRCVTRPSTLISLQFIRCEKEKKACENDIKKQKLDFYDYQPVEVIFKLELAEGVEELLWDHLVTDFLS